MSAIQSGKVLVTGANGFVAGAIIEALLTHGFSVRGTVRSLDKAEGLRNALAAYGPDKLEFVTVADITVEGAFDDAIQGIDAVVHVASPVNVSTQDPAEIITPAVNGTTSVLRSASAAGSTVKRIVYISSLAAVVNSRMGPSTVYTEEIWNDNDPAEVEAKGADAHPAVKYRASKTLAERAAWNTYREGKQNGSIAWDLVSLCPPWVFGPYIGATDPEQLKTSPGMWYSLCVKEEGEEPTWDTWLSYVDLRDFAEAVRASLTIPEAGGERFIISAGPFEWAQWVSIARRLLGKPTLPETPTPDLQVFFDAKKSQRILGIRYRDKEETAACMIKDLKSKGWC